MDTRTALLKSGKAEFLDKGFEKASLRTICAHANVTTGALYAHFKSKNDLFCSIVENDLGDFKGLCDELAERLAKLATRDPEGEKEAVGIVMEHRDLFKLLFDCSNGTSYEGFKESLIRQLEKCVLAIFDERAHEPVDPRVIKTLVRMKFSQYCEMIYGDYDNESVRLITDKLGSFTLQGVQALL